jgi:hypothetical protein
MHFLAWRGKWQTRNTCKISVEKFLRKQLVERPRRRCENNLKVDIKEIRFCALN